MRKLFILSICSILLSFSTVAQSETTFDRRIDELQTLQDLLAAHRAAYEEEERQFSEPVWLTNGAGLPYIADGAALRRKIEKYILVMRGMGLDRAAQATLSLEKQALLAILGEERVDTLAVDKIMKRLHRDSESIRRDTMLDIDGIRSQIASELASLKDKAAVLDATLTTGSEDRCATVSAQQGWQEIEVPASASLAEISGAWNVHSPHPQFGPEGYSGTLEANMHRDFSHFKYDKGAPFASLLRQRGPGGHDRVSERSMIVTPGETLRLRINDVDEVLHDNAGALSLCFD